MTTATSETVELSRAARWAVLAAAFGGLVFDGFELGLIARCIELSNQELVGNE